MRLHSVGIDDSDTACEVVFRALRVRPKVGPLRVQELLILGLLEDLLLLLLELAH